MRETPLQMATRHVAQQEGLIQKQKALIARMVAAALPIEAAEEMLETMKDLLRVYQQDLARLSN